MNIIEWRDSLLESNLSYKAKYMGLILSQFYRPRNATYPAIRTLVDLSGLTQNPVQDGLTELEQNEYISRKQARLPGNRFISNIYVFTGVIENEHVSPRDTSKFTSNITSNDTSKFTSNDTSFDTSDDTSFDMSPGDTEREEVEEVEEHSLKLDKSNSKECVVEAKKNSHTHKEISEKEFLELGKKERPDLSLESVRDSHGKFIQHYPPHKRTFEFARSWLKMEIKPKFETPKATNENSVPWKIEDEEIHDKLFREVRRRFHIKYEMTFINWIRHMVVIQRRGSVIELGVTSSYLKNEISRHHLGKLQSIFLEVEPEIKTIELSITQKKEVKDARIG